jgi:hypothetical protein
VPDPIDVRRTRPLGALISDAATLLRDHLGLFALLAAAVVVPVELLLSGIGMGQLYSGYDESPPLGGTGLLALVGALVTTPLITAMFVTVVLDLAAGREPDPRRAARVALDVFAPLLLVVVLAFAGIVLGFLALIIPGIILALRWTVSAQAVVVEGKRGREALARSWELTKGRALFVFGVLLVSGILTALAGGLVSIPADALAESADLGIIVLLATMLVNVFSFAYTALVATLLYVTLRAERGEPLVPGREGTRASGEGLGGQRAPGSSDERDAFGNPVAAPAPWSPPGAPAERSPAPGTGSGDDAERRPGSVAPPGWEPPRPG